MKSIITKIRENVRGNEKRVYKTSLVVGSAVILSLITGPFTIFQ